MDDLGSVTRTLMSIARSGIDDRELAERICRACLDGLDVDGAAISLLTASSSRQTLWATDTTAELLEDLQFSLNEGACMEAATTGRPVFVADLHHSGHVAQWPVFADAVAARTAVGALFALPLQWGAVNLGVLDLYRVQPGPLSTRQQRDALAAADTAALMLLGQRTEPLGSPNGLHAGSGDGWLDESTSRHAVVHQATGMVLVQLGIGAGDALARMRGHAFAHQRLLLDVARDVVNRRLAFTDDQDDR